MQFSWLWELKRIRHRYAFRTRGSYATPRCVLRLKRQLRDRVSQRPRNHTAVEPPIAAQTQVVQLRLSHAWQLRDPSLRPAAETTASRARSPTPKKPECSSAAYRSSSP